MNVHFFYIWKTILTALSRTDISRDQKSVHFWRRTEKTTAIRRIAVRETNVSQHHKGPIEGPLKPLGPSQHYCCKGFEGALNCSTIMPRHAGPFFFQSTFHGWSCHYFFFHPISLLSLCNTESNKFKNHTIFNQIWIEITLFLLNYWTPNGIPFDAN